jgi:hypothetical protein
MHHICKQSGLKQIYLEIRKQYSLSLTYLVPLDPEEWPFLEEQIEDYAELSGVDFLEMLESKASFVRLMRLQWSLCGFLVPFMFSCPFWFTLPFLLIAVLLRNIAELMRSGLLSGISIHSESRLSYNCKIIFSTGGSSSFQANHWWYREAVSLFPLFLWNGKTAI